MFEAIRRNQRVLQFLLLLLIFPAFAFFGISGYNTFFISEDSVAKVGKLSISSQEFENARQGQLANMRRMFGDQLDPAVFDNPQAREEILDRLVNDRLLASEAQDKGIVVPDTAVRNAIQNSPEFKDDNGKFSLEKYNTLIAGAGMSSSQYENRIRGSLALGAIPQSVQNTGFIPRTVSRQLVKLQQQKRKFRSRTFKAEDFHKQVEVDTAKARAFYDANKKRFESTESAKVEYLVLSGTELAKAAAVTDEELTKYYQDHKSKYVNVERRETSHILLNMPAESTEDQKKVARDKAKSLLEKLRAGADFAALAKTESQDPGSADKGGDLGFIDRQSVVAPFADAAFALKEGEISDVVESEFGLHIIKLNKIQPEAGMPFDKAKAQVETEVRAAKGREAFLAAASGFNDTVYEQPDSLAPTAEKLKLKVQIIETLNRFGAPDLPPDSPLRDRKVLRELFSERSIKEKTNIEAVETGDNVLVSARILEHRPAALQPFEKVEAEAIAHVRAKEAGELAKKAGEAELEKLKGGAPVSGFEEEKSITRNEPGQLPNALQALFAALPNDLPKFIGVDLEAGGYMIQQLLEVVDASDTEIDQALDGLAAQSAPAEGQLALESLIGALKARIPVTRDLDRLNRATPVADGAVN